MTTRLYHTEPYRTSFDARVRSCESREGRIEVVLDQTAFYPTSGGQPFDVGTLGEAAVVEVSERDDGALVHVVDRAVPEGAEVSGQIDWTRRFDHMQQHTGQHVLSAAFDRLFGARTESFHLGATSATIDLARELSADDIRIAEDEANRIIWQDRPVGIRFVSSEEAATLPLRKEPARTGLLRLIEIEDFDLSACGGTHVARTGGIGVIATTGAERFRGGLRVEFLCGGRVAARFRQWRDVLAATTRHLSVQPPELASAVEKLQVEAKAAQKTIRAQQEQLAGYEGTALAARAEPVGDRLIVTDALDGWDAPGLKAIAAAAVATRPSLAVTLFNRSEPAIVVAASGAASGVDAAAIVRQLIASYGGKGGGRRELAQGGGLSAATDELLASASRLLRG